MVFLRKISVLALVLALPLAAAPAVRAAEASITIDAQTGYIL